MIGTSVHDHTKEEEVTRDIRSKQEARSCNRRASTLMRDHLYCALQKKFHFRSSRRAELDLDTMHQVLHVVHARAGHENTELGRLAVRFNPITILVAVLRIRQPTRKALVKRVGTQLRSCQLIKTSTRVARMRRGAHHSIKELLRMSPGEPPLFRITNPTHDTAVGHRLGALGLGLGRD